jgi:hypothetical protein
MGGGAVSSAAFDSVVSFGVTIGSGIQTGLGGVACRARARLSALCGADRCDVDLCGAAVCVALAFGAIALGGLAVGALGLVALAVGVLAVGALAVGVLGLVALAVGLFNAEALAVVALDVAAASGRRCDPSSGPDGDAFAIRGPAFAERALCGADRFGMPDSGDISVPPPDPSLTPEVDDFAV